MKYLVKDLNLLTRFRIKGCMEKFFLCMAFLCIFANNDDFIKEKEYKICKKMPDAYINKYIQELNEEKDDIDVLYKINKNGDMIEFCESWIKYIMENKNSILYLIKHKLISYLETKNPNDNKIEFKLGRKLATDKNLSF